jgi:hypothetical protein
MGAKMNELVTLKKIEQSKLAIREVKTLGEIKKLVDQSEALKAYAKSAQMSAEIQSDIAELNLIATRRLGEISAALEKKSGGDRKSENQKSGSRTFDDGKTAALSSVGVSRQRANEAEKLAKIDDGVFNELLKTSKEIPIPKADMEKLSRMEPEQQREVANKITSGEAKSVSEAQRKVINETVKENLENVSAKKAKELKGVYDVIVIDPPWEMEKIERDERPRQTGFDYPVMDEGQLEKLKIPVAEEIYNSISSKSVSREVAIKLIENYGLRRERNAIEEMQKGVSHSEEIENGIKRIIEKLDELFERTMEACQIK